jgi:hypothetical protein
MILKLSTPRRLPDLDKKGGKGMSMHMRTSRIGSNRPGTWLLIGGFMVLMLACNVTQAEKKVRTDVDPCVKQGISWRVDGEFLPLADNPWQRTTRTLFLQFNSACDDVYGYGDIVSTLVSSDRTETITQRISFKGGYATGKLTFDGTVYVDMDQTCQGDCEGFPPYSFDYPANWNARLNPGGDPYSFTITGWIDGFGDFLLNKPHMLSAAEDKDFRDVPGLEIWP